MKGVCNFDKKLKKVSKSVLECKKIKIVSVNKEEKIFNFEDFVDFEDGLKVFFGDDIEEFMVKVQCEKVVWMKVEVEKEVVVKEKGESGEKGYDEF